MIMPHIHAPGIVERLRFFEQTDDGFALAEKDLEIRGPGAVLGTRQHGLPDLRIADLLEDRELLFKARNEAFDLVRDDPTFKKPENKTIRDTLEQRYGGREDLLRVG
jgi:ATP-dependent DNA helicase RecG